MSNATNDQSHLGPSNETSPTEFGHSVESRAQILDSSTTAGKEAELLNIYRLVPIADANDPRWDNSPYQGEVVVAAHTTSDACIVAAERELDFMEIDSAPAEGVTTSNASAFRSETMPDVLSNVGDRGRNQRRHHQARSSLTLQALLIPRTT